MHPPKKFTELAAPSEYCYEEKKSTFLAKLWPVADKEAGFVHLAETKASYPDARHICWAYLIGDPEQAKAAGFNDDGEPGGTAGRPMLNVITQRKVGNVFAVVIRYFGGIKLGAGGLTRAYGQAISGALDCAQLRIIVPTTLIHITAHYGLEDRLRNVLHQFNVSQVEVHYSHCVELRCAFPTESLPALQQTVQDHSAGTALLTIPNE